MKLSIIIVTYNSQKFIEGCLSSCQKKIKDLKYEIIVIDNASRDKTLKILKDFPKIKIIKNRQNIGYSAACNQGLKKTSGKYIFLLNPDTILIDGAVGKMISFLEKNPHIAVVGPRNFSGNGRPAVSAYPKPNLCDLCQEGNVTYAFSPTHPILSRLVYRYRFRRLCFFGQRPRQVGWVSGAALLIRRKIAQKIGPKDEKLFAYGEEPDWLWSLDPEKEKVYFLPRAEIIHFGAESSKISWKEMARRIKSSYYDRVYFCQKHFPNWLFILRFIMSWELIFKVIWRFLFCWEKTERRARLKTYYQLIRWNSFEK